MQYVFLAAQKVLGMTLKPGDPDVLLFEGDNPRTRATITRQLDSHWAVLDRHLVLASMMLRGKLGNPLPGDFHENLANETEAVREHRSGSFGNDGIIAIEIRGEVHADVKEPLREIDDFILCFDAFDKRALRSQLQTRVASVLAAVRMGGGGSYELESIGTGSYLIGADGRTIHSFSPEVGHSDCIHVGAFDRRPNSLRASRHRADLG